MAETASGSNVQSKQSTCYQNLTWQNKARNESNKCIEQKSLTDHGYDANHGKNKFIACMDQLQQPWQN